MLSTILQRIDACGRDTVVDLQTRLVAIPAIGPLNGGTGEKEKTEEIERYLADLGITRLERIDAPDDTVPCGFRPNLAAIIPGEDTGRTLWIISHVDVVPEGDRSLWQTDPFTLTVDGDVLIGRGVEDDHQGIVSSTLLARALMDTGTVPPINLGLLYVADEETGSALGLDYVVRQRPGLFAENDLFLVPDFGRADSSLVEVAEKSMFWLKVIVNGKQCHASTPDEGINTLVASADFILRIREVEEAFAGRDPLFDPPRSTMTPTRKEENVGNVNTIPGRDVFYVDCRVLPEYSLDEVMDAIEAVGKKVEAEHGVSIDYAFEMREQAAPPTPADGETATRLMRGIQEVYGVTPRPVGIGGGTVAAFLRRRGYEAVVWATCEHNAHQPNERSRISWQINDAKVMAHALLS